MKQKTTPPQIEVFELADLTEGIRADLGSHSDRELEHYEGFDLSNTTMLDSVFRECRFQSPRMTGANIRGISFYECIFDGLDAATIDASRSRWRDVRIAASRIGSAELYDSDWRSVHFESSKLGYLNLRNAEIVDLKFSKCTIEELDLSMAKVVRLAFDDCQVRTLHLSESTLKDFDIRGADIDKVGNVADLGGATVSEAQLMRLAPALATAFRLTVE